MTPKGSLYPITSGTNAIVVVSSEYRRLPSWVPRDMSHTHITSIWSEADSLLCTEFTVFTCFFSKKHEFRHINFQKNLELATPNLKILKILTI